MAFDDVPPTGGFNTTGNVTGGGGGMGGRIRRILLDPKREWPAIDAEPMTVRGIMMGWVVPLAAIGPVANLIGSQIFGINLIFAVIRPPLMTSIVTAIVSYLLALVSVWALSLVIDGLAPSFGGTKNPVAAMKVAAFSATASYLAQIFGIVPMLLILSLVGLYSLYLLYLGLPRLMRAPEDKALVYTIVTILVAAILFIVVGSITRAIAWRTTAPALATAGGTISVPGVGSVDMGKLDQAAQQMAAAGNQMAAAANAQASAANTQAAVQGQATAGIVPAASLAALLPASIGGWTRSEIETGSGGAAGIGGSSATAHYTQGNDTMTLAVTDLGAMGALASIGSALNVQSSKQTATGYEKTGTVDGRMTTQKWDSASREGEYMTMVGNRFTISAEGHAPSDAAFKAAVDTVDAGKLAALAPAK